MIKKIRKICAVCKAKKYVKYLVKQLKIGGLFDEAWICKNPNKCKNRGANYKK